MINNILLFSNFELPDSCANATRVIGFAKILRDCGYNVILIGVTYKDDIAPDGEFEGFHYQNIQGPRFYGIQAYKRKSIINKMVSEKLQDLKGSIDAIILSGAYCDSTKPFIKFYKETAIPLIVNMVEWYDFGNEMFSGVIGKIKFIQNRYTLRKTYVKMNNIIAISSLLDSYYSKKGCNTCVVPTIIDIDNYKELVHANQTKLQIAYAGHAGKKDYIINIIRALSLLTEEERSKIEMHFYGVKSEDVVHLGLSQSEILQLNDCVFYHGRISQNSVKEKIGAADFTVLLRPNKRYANAGFPTKVGESMAAGTPVIANITSDLGKYIIDGKTGIVCEDESVDSCLKALRRAIELSDEEKTTMRTFAAEMAKNSFDYRSYINTLRGFINKIKH